MLIHFLVLKLVVTVYCQYGEWNDWLGECPTNCSEDKMYEVTRSCIESRDSDESSSLCSIGDLDQVWVTCLASVCSVDGNWGDWTELENNFCSATCDGGHIQQYRECNDPVPSQSGARCNKEDGSIGTFERRSLTCNTQPCCECTSWLVVADCVKVNSTNLKISQRTCSGVCGGPFEKYESCDPQEHEPATPSTQQKANGVLKLYNITQNGVNLNDTQLKSIVQNEGQDYAILKQNIEEVLLRNFQKKNITVFDVTVLNITVGSLIIDYIFTFKTENESISSYDQLNPIQGDVEFFPENSTFGGRTSERSSFVSDYDECSKDEDSCDKDAYCYNIPNQIFYVCQCKQGFKGNGFSCDEKESGIPKLLIIIIAAGSLVLLIAIVVVIILCRRSQKPIPKKKGLENVYDKVYANISVKVIGDEKEENPYNEIESSA